VAVDAFIEAATKEQEKIDALAKARANRIKEKNEKVEEYKKLLGHAQGIIKLVNLKLNNKELSPRFRENESIAADVKAAETLLDEVVQLVLNGQPDDENPAFDSDEGKDGVLKTMEAAVNRLPEIDSCKAKSDALEDVVNKQALPLAADGDLTIKATNIIIAIEDELNADKKLETDELQELIAVAKGTEAAARKKSTDPVDATSLETIQESFTDSAKAVSHAIADADAANLELAKDKQAAAAAAQATAQRTQDAANKEKDLKQRLLAQEEVLKALQKDLEGNSALADDTAVKDAIAAADVAVKAGWEVLGKDIDPSSDESLAADIESREAAVATATTACESATKLVADAKAKLEEDKARGENANAEKEKLLNDFEPTLQKWKELQARVGSDPELSVIEDVKTALDTATTKVAQVDEQIAQEMDTSSEETVKEYLTSLEAKIKEATTEIENASQAAEKGKTELEAAAAAAAEAAKARGAELKLERKALLEQMDKADAERKEKVAEVKAYSKECASQDKFEACKKEAATLFGEARAVRIGTEEIDKDAESSYAEREKYISEHADLKQKVETFIAKVDELKALADVIKEENDELVNASLKKAAEEKRTALKAQVEEMCKKFHALIDPINTDSGSEMETAVAQGKSEEEELKTLVDAELKFDSLDEDAKSITDKMASLQTSMDKINALQAAKKQEKAAELANITKETGAVKLNYDKLLQEWQKVNQAMFQELKGFENVKGSFDAAKAAVGDLDKTGKGDDVEATREAITKAEEAIKAASIAVKEASERYRIYKKSKGFGIHPSGKDSVEKVESAVSTMSEEDAAQYWKKSTWVWGAARYEYSKVPESNQLEMCKAKYIDAETKWNALDGMLNSPLDTSNGDVGAARTKLNRTFVECQNSLDEFADTGEILDLQKALDISLADFATLTQENESCNFGSVKLLDCTRMKSTLSDASSLEQKLLKAKAETAQLAPIRGHVNNITGLVKRIKKTSNNEKRAAKARFEQGPKIIENIKVQLKEQKEVMTVCDTKDGVVVDRTDAPFDVMQADARIALQKADKTLETTELSITDENDYKQALAKIQKDSDNAIAKVEKYCGDITDDPTDPLAAFNFFSRRL
jgi:hypothetical protein